MFPGKGPLSRIGGEVEKWESPHSSRGGPYKTDSLFSAERQIDGVGHKDSSKG